MNILPPLPEIYAVEFLVCEKITGLAHQTAGDAPYSEKAVLLALPSPWQVSITDWFVRQGLAP